MLYNIILRVIESFPKNTNFYSHGAKRVLTEKIAKEIIKELDMKLSNQAIGAIMMALQKSLMEQSDIVPVIGSFQFQLDEEEQLKVLNPPSFRVTETREEQNTVGSD